MNRKRITLNEAIRRGFVSATSQNKTYLDDSETVLTFYHWG